MVLAAMVRSPSSHGFDRARPAREKARDDWLASWEAELQELELRLSADTSADGARGVLHRLLALVSGWRSDETVGALAAPAGTHGPSPGRVRETHATQPGSAGPAADGWFPRLEAVIETIHALVATVASRLGARGYSIGVSLPAGFSVTVDFDLPAPPASAAGAALDKGLNPPRPDSPTT